jgi:thioredoxin 1
MAAEIKSAADFEKRVLGADKPVLVDFFAPWCGPCKMLTPLLEEMAPKLEGKAEIVKLNVDQVGDVAASYGIMAVPTVLVFKNGEMTSRLTGLRKAEEYLSALGVDAPSR